MNERYTLFDRDTYRERLGRARTAVARHGLDACISVAPENHYYLGGYDSWTGLNSPQAMIFTRGGDEPTLLLRDVDLPLALESTWITDIRTYRLHREDFAEIVRTIVQEKGCRADGIGIEFQSSALPFSLGKVLSEALAPATLVDATEILGTIRLVKSPQELALITRAGEYAALGLRAMEKAVIPGTTEIKVAAQIESALRNAGSDYWAIPVELTSGSRSAGCHGTPRNRVIEPGDLVHGEFAGVCERYHAVAMQTLGCGPVNARQSEIYELARQSLEAGISVVAPGVRVCDVEQASLEPLMAQGVEQAAMMRFGYGIGIAYPPVWLEPLQISRDFNTVLEAGMAFVLHACLEFPEEGTGVILGGTYVLQDHGPAMVAGAGTTGLRSVPGPAIE